MTAATITLEQLRAHGACEEGRNAFFDTFGPIWTVTIASATNNAAVAHLDWTWAAENLLSNAAQAEYTKVRNAASDEYDKVCSPASDEYNKVRNAAWAECTKVCSHTSDEYTKVCNATWAEYNKVRNAAQAEYDKVRNAAWAEYNKVRNAASDEYTKVCAETFAMLYIRDNQQPESVTLTAAQVQDLRGVLDGLRHCQSINQGLIEGDYRDGKLAAYGNAVAQVAGFMTRVGISED